MYKVLVIGMLAGPNGVSTSMMNLYRNMDRSKIQWEFIFLKEYEKINKTKSGSYEDEIRRLGGNIHYMKYTHHDFPHNSRKKLREIMLNDPEIMGVHVHDLATNTYPLILANQLDRPIKIIHFHSAAAKSKIEDAVKNASRRKKIRLKMISDDSYDRWCCSDLSGKTAYLNYPFEVFPNAVDTKKFSFNPIYRNIVRTKLSIPEDATVFGFVATIYHVKNPLYAIKVFEQYRKQYDKNAHMILIGGGQQLTELIEYSKKRHLTKCLHILGQQVEIDVFYSAFDMFLCPSLSEGFPNTLTEAQSSGCQCLVSDEVTEMVKLTDLVEFASIEQRPSKWAEKAREMILNAPERRSWGEEVKAAGYDIVDAADRLVNHYLYRIRKWKKEHRK